MVDVLDTEETARAAALFWQHALAASVLAAALAGVLLWRAWDRVHEAGEE